MVELISRTEALAHQALTNQVYSLQEIMRNPDNDLDQKRNNATYRKKKAAYKRLKDELTPDQRELYGSYIYNLAPAPLDAYVVSLGECLQALAEQTGTPLTFLLDYQIAWLSQANEFAPVQAAMDHLRAIGMADDYVGGIRADGDDLPAIVDAVFWLGRCNTSLPYCWFTAGNADVVGSICQHGNLHFDVYSEEGETAVKTFIATQAITEIEECANGFTE